MTNILLKAIKLNLNTNKALEEHYISSGISNNQIVVSFSKEVDFYNTETKKLDKKTLANEEIEKLSEIEGFDRIEVAGEAFLIYFNHPDIEDIEILYQAYNPSVGDFAKPYNDNQINEQQKTIDTITDQIKLSREQADNWEKDLNNIKKPALQNMLDENQRFSDKLNKAVKQGWI